MMRNARENNNRSTKSGPLTPNLCRAARALLGWSQDQLADASAVATKTIADFERQARTPYMRTLRDVRSALENAGIEFIDPNGGGAGLRLKKKRGV